LEEAQELSEGESGKADHRSKVERMKRKKTVSVWQTLL
jgi:hypothetical protein